MKCTGCGVEGHERNAVISVDDAMLSVVECSHDMPETMALFRYGGDLVCMICLCKITTTCVSCLEGVDTLYKDGRCKSEPMVCGPCLRRPERNHLWKCYGDGCMTIEELATEEQYILENS